MMRITEDGARIMVQQLVRSFVDATPYNEEPNAFVTRALKLQASLGRILGVTPSHYDIEELVTSFEELDSVEHGTHPELVTNLAGTVDNTDLVRDYLVGRIGRETTALLTNAGFGKMVAA
jgi:hypothetical protein